ncbi:MAG: lipoyl(octanoyl) transferase LipB [Sulfuriflexus sp.]|nr:lipoyl(octanoyl) transferase LipB [Sulfuriflexus sp.]
MTIPEAIVIRDLGQQDYIPTFDAMREYTAARTPESPDEFWLVEHPPVFTQGRNSKPEHLLNPGDIQIVDIDRGGQVTYHGPGQLVLYTLIDLSRAKKGVRDLVTAIEQSIIKLLAEYALTAHARSDAPGVYVDNAKLAALGLRVTRGRSYHGLSLNIDMDLSPFQRINPCGYPDMAITQCRELGIEDPLPMISDRLCTLLATELGYNARVYEPTRSITDLATNRA